MVYLQYLPMKKILVVYYSRTGMTKKLALSISDMLGADCEEIIDTKKRAWVVWYIMAGRDAALKKQTTIQNITKNPSEYDIVCIWTGHMNKKHPKLRNCMTAKHTHYYY